MIGKISRGKNFGGLVRYLLKPEKEAIVLDSTVAIERMEDVSTADRQNIASSFQSIADAHHRVITPVKHFVIGFAEQDKIVSDEVKREIATKLLSKLGYDNAQRLVVAHRRDDPALNRKNLREHEHDHVHIMVNSVDLTGEWVKDHWDHYRMQSALRELEKEHGLHQIKSSWEKGAERNNGIAKEKGFTSVDRQELLTIRQQIKNVLTESAASNPTLAQFIAQVQTAGIEVDFKITRNDIVQGMSYTLTGDDGSKSRIKGSSIEGFSFQKLAAVQGIRYDPSQDLPMLKLVNAGRKLKLSTEKRDRSTQITVEPESIPEETAQNIEEMDRSTQVAAEPESASEETIDRSTTKPNPFPMSFGGANPSNRSR
jgi:Relaxase/Mobilisation nuclease domain